MLDDYKVFLVPQNCGVTLSGGETLVQPTFVSAVYQRVHEMGLTTCLDTACHGNKRTWDEVLPHTDYVMLCLKGIDDRVASTSRIFHDRLVDLYHICQKMSNTKADKSFSYV